MYKDALVGSFKKNFFTEIAEINGKTLMIMLGCINGNYFQVFCTQKRLRPNESRLQC